MRKVLIAIVLACTLLLMVQCSGIETLNDFNGKVVTVVSPAKKAYPDPDLSYMHFILSDSLIWVYDYAPGAESRVSIVASGMVQTYNVVIDQSDGSLIEAIPIGIERNHFELAIETYTDTIVSFKKLNINSDGTFRDTVFIASSSSPELILPQSSRLSVVVDEIVSDTIPLPNPHGIKK